MSKCHVLVMTKIKRAGSEHKKIPQPTAKCDELGFVAGEAVQYQTVVVVGFIGITSSFFGGSSSLMSNE